MDFFHTKQIPERAKRTRPGVFVATLAALALGACGGGEGGTQDDAAAGAATEEGGGPGVRLTLGEDTMEFTGGRCFVTESGGSQGAVSLSKATTADGAELGIDWAGDSPDSAMVRVDMPDGTQFEASSFGASPDAFDVTVRGSTATIRTTMRSLYEPNAQPVPAELEVRCR